MANIAVVWRPATVRTIPIIHFTSAFFMMLW